MNNIPDDIMQAACALAGEVEKHITPRRIINASGMEAIARALMAERERCSKGEDTASVYFERIATREAENARLLAAMERARTILGNMALENEGAIFNRWPINHEPLRADARGLLPIIDNLLEGKDERFR